MWILTNRSRSFSELWYSNILLLFASKMADKINICFPSLEGLNIKWSDITIQSVNVCKCSTALIVFIVKSNKKDNWKSTDVLKCFTNVYYLRFSTHKESQHVQCVYILLSTQCISLNTSHDKYHQNNWIGFTQKHHLWKAFIILMQPLL